MKVLFSSIYMMLFAGVCFGRQVDSAAPPQKESGGDKGVPNEYYIEEKHIEYERNRQLQQEYQRVEKQRIKQQLRLQEKKNGQTSKTTQKPDIFEGSTESQNKKVDASQSEFNTRKRVITGPSQYDSRIETRILDPKVPWQNKILLNAKSVGMVVERSSMHPITDSIFQLDVAQTLGQRFQLCQNEAFYDQPILGTGTAFIISKNKMATANHVFIGNLNNYAIVFGFEIINKLGAYEVFFPKENIYYPRKILNTDINADLCTFLIDRNTTRPVLQIVQDEKLQVNTPVYMIGYPMGLPQKVALNAEIIANHHPLYFYTSLDAFQGNSGSPVFNFDTNNVVGILVSGEVDYIWHGGCKVSTLCRLPYCTGEKVMKITDLALP